jgi:hypothetical protein
MHMILSLSFELSSLKSAFKYSSIHAPAGSIHEEKK